MSLLFLVQQLVQFVHQSYKPRGILLNGNLLAKPLPLLFVRLHGPDLMVSDESQGTFKRFMNPPHEPTIRWMVHPLLPATKRKVVPDSETASKDTSEIPTGPSDSNAARAARFAKQKKPRAPGRGDSRHQCFNIGYPESLFRNGAIF